MDGGCPFVAGAADGGFVDVPEVVAAAVKERRAPVSYDDHYSQARMFFRSLSPVEQDHVVNAYTFELSRCFEQTIRERQLRALANIDTGLCELVATGLGLPAPAADIDVVELEPTAAITQLGGTWPLDGRQIGIVVGPATDAAPVEALRAALFAADAVPLVVGPTGGQHAGTTVQRTYANAASIEFDAVILVGDLPPAADALTSIDAKSGAADEVVVDPRIVKLVGEVWRHAKAIGAVDAADALAVCGVPDTAAGVVSGDANAVAGQLLTLMGAHRAWERFTAAV